MYGDYADYVDREAAKKKPNQVPMKAGPAGSTRKPKSTAKTKAKAKKKK